MANTHNTGPEPKTHEAVVPKPPPFGTGGDLGKTLTPEKRTEEPTKRAPEPGTPDAPITTKTPEQGQPMKPKQA